MKLILKILFAPIILLLWLFCGVCNLCLKLSATVLFIVSIPFAIMGIITIFTGAVLKGCIGLAVALALSPYGIPTLAALILARFYIFRYWLKDTIYG